MSFDELRYFGIAFHHRSLAILGVGGVQHDDSPHVVIRASTMAIPIKASLLALILLLTPLSSGMAEGFKDGTSPIYLLHKDRTLVNSKKLLKLDAVLDYDYAEANPKHDPRKGKPGNGGGGKNP
ncbi:hypothetical protein AAG906_007129 [Vitis piasezkii]